MKGLGVGPSTVLLLGKHKRSGYGSMCFGFNVTNSWGYNGICIYIYIMYTYNIIYIYIANDIVFGFV